MIEKSDNELIMENYPGAYNQTRQNSQYAPHSQGPSSAFPGLQGKGKVEGSPYSASTGVEQESEISDSSEILVPGYGSMRLEQLENLMRRCVEDIKRMLDNGVYAVDDKLSLLKHFKNTYDAYMD
jgi:hypothetical protein